MLIYFFKQKDSRRKPSEPSQIYTNKNKRDYKILGGHQPDPVKSHKNVTN
jgi:hypothetical protein